MSAYLLFSSGCFVLHCQPPQKIMENAEFCLEIPPWNPYHFNSTQKNRYQIYNQDNRRRSMSLPLPGQRFQTNPTVPECPCCGYQHQQCRSPYHFPQYQQSYPQSNPSHQLQPQLLPRISAYGQLCSHPLYGPSPFGYLAGFRQELQENVGQGNRRIAAAKRSVQPPGGVIKEGQFFFSNKIYVHLSLEQQVRLGAVNPGTQNKCRKIRPWLVLWKLNNGNVIVV